MPPAVVLRSRTGLSTDGTTEFLEAAARDSRVTIIRKGPPLGGKSEMVNAFLGRGRATTSGRLDARRVLLPRGGERPSGFRRRPGPHVPPRSTPHYFFGDTQTVVERSGLGNDDFYWNWMRCLAPPSRRDLPHPRSRRTKRPAARALPLARRVNLSTAKHARPDETEAAAPCSTTSLRRRPCKSGSRRRSTIRRGSTPPGSACARSSPAASTRGSIRNSRCWTTALYRRAAHAVRRPAPAQGEGIR